MEFRQATILDGTDSNELLGSKVKERVIEAYESAGYTVIIHLKLNMYEKNSMFHKINLLL